MDEIFVVILVLLWVLVIANLLLTLVIIRKLSPNQHKTETLVKGQDAPNFTAETLTGEKTSLADYAGRNTAFLFVSPGCAPCREAIPLYNVLGPKATEAGVDLVLVSIADAPATKALVEEMNIRLPVLVAPRGFNPFAADYKATGTPSYCLVDSEGKVLGSGHPSLEHGDWKKMVFSWQTGSSSLDKVAVGASS
jgi:peroxiredoxin